VTTRPIIDLVVIGGGINGIGIAADAAGRGLQVTLCEQSDLASGTSSASSKFFHGGLRYLENFEFELVHRSLQERNILLERAPCLVTPREFVIHHHSGRRPQWLIKLGLFLQDKLGGKKLEPANKLSLKDHLQGLPLKTEFDIGHLYSDCTGDDARLVILNALLAKEKGAHILGRHKVLNAKRTESYWEVEVQNLLDHSKKSILCKTLINATGPWTNQFLSNSIKSNSRCRVKLSKGSHIIVPKLYDGEHAYILQNEDNHLICVIPFEHDYSLIGATDMVHEGPPEPQSITREEEIYLCQAVSDYFKKPINIGDIIWSYSGLRPIYDDSCHDSDTACHDYLLDFDCPDGHSPLINIFGGRLTTYRRVAEQVLDLIAPYLDEPGEPWTSDAPLPGNQLNQCDIPALQQELKLAYPWLPEKLQKRLVASYGTLSLQILKNANQAEDLGECFSPLFYEAEAEYLINQEWAMTPDDILWRRTKLGLHLTKQEQSHFKQWFSKKHPEYNALYM